MAKTFLSPKWLLAAMFQAMDPFSQAWRKFALWMGLGLLLGASSPARAADSLVWRQDLNRVDADIMSWDLRTLLENISAATGWQIYLEPETKHAVSTKFKDRTPGEALQLLMPDLTAILLPQTNAPGKLCVFRTSVQEATQLIVAPKKSASPRISSLITNELVVTLKPGAKIDDLARELGAKVIGRADGLNAYRLQFEDAEATERARAALQKNSDVASVDSNYTVFQPPEGQELTYSSAPPLSLKPKAVGDANRIIIGLIDTAIQPQSSAVDAFLLPSISVAGETKLDPTHPSHGTSMSETILRGISMMVEDNEGSSVRILPVDVYGNNSTTSTFDVAYGIYKAINAGANIINLSLGSDGTTSYLRQVIESGHQQGVLFFAAAGNAPVDSPTFPAAYPEVIAVTAADRNGNVASWANYGDFVDVVAPGSSIVTFNNQKYLVMGTSASSAYAAGMAAGLADASHKLLPEVEAAIRKNMARNAKP